MDLPRVPGQIFEPRERVLVRFARDPVLWHARWVLNFVRFDEDGVGVYTVLTPDRDVQEQPMGPPSLLGMVRYVGRRMPGVADGEIYSDRHSGRGPYAADELEGFFVRFARSQADGAPLEVVGRPWLGVEGARLLGGGRQGAWLTTERGEHGDPGLEVVPTAESIFIGDRGLVPCRGRWVACEFVPAGEEEQFLERRGLQQAAEGRGPGEPTGRPEGESPEEIRTLAVVWDEHGGRFREWKDLVKCLQDDAFPDWPIEGPRTMLWLAKFFARQGLSPVVWLERHLRDHRYGDSDRSVHELRALAEVMEHAGCYDQLNLAALASFELLARRWQLILDAHSGNPLQPNYEAAEYYSGLEKMRFGVAPELTAHVARRMKDDTEIERQRTKARELRGVGGPGGGVGSRDRPAAPPAKK